MKNIIIVLVLLLLLSLTVGAKEVDSDVKACRLLSHDNVICDVNDNGDCECKAISKTKGKNVQGGLD